MTHFIGAVLAPANRAGVTTSPTKYPVLYGEGTLETEPSEQLMDYLNRALARFDENKSIETWTPKADVIAKSRAGVQAYAESEMYREFRADPVAYAAKRSDNPSHLRYLQEEFPKKLEWTDEEHWANAISFEEPEDVTDEAIRSWYNPDSRWDWWTIGGRWEETYRDKQGQPVSALISELETTLVALENPEEVAKAAAFEAVHDEARRAYYSAMPGSIQKGAEAHLDKVAKQLQACPAYISWSFPYSVVHPKGEDFEWTEKGRMGWFGMSDDSYSDADWLKELKGVFESAPEDFVIYYIDFHI